jgi:hypothetical protein
MTTTPPAAFERESTVDTDIYKLSKQKENGGGEGRVEN